jgi:predicted DNA binding CopG/RHH family protein
MSKKTEKNKKRVYTHDKGEGPSAKAYIVNDFLPSPAELAGAMKKTKITIELTSKSAGFFKEQATKLDVPYQAMIRELLDRYVEQATRK